MQILFRISTIMRTTKNLSLIEEEGIIILDSLMDISHSFNELFAISKKNIW